MTWKLCPPSEPNMNPGCQKLRRYAQLLQPRPWSRPSHDSSSECRLPAIVYPESNSSPEVKVTHSVHAECTLAMHAIAMKKEWKYVEIGVSKGSCWLCEKFLGLVRTPNLQFLVPGQ